MPKHFDEPADVLTYELGRICTALYFTDPVLLCGNVERGIIAEAVEALATVQERIAELHPASEAAE